MGQYHVICNLDKREVIVPHAFGDGLKLLEFGSSAQGTLLGLAVLLAAANRHQSRGGGDLHPWSGDLHPWMGGPGYEGRELDLDPVLSQAYMDHIVGRWAGDRVAIVGDYIEPDDLPGVPSGYQCEKCHARYDDYQAECTCGGHVYSHNLYTVACEQEDGWVDISDHVVAAMEMDYYVHTERHREQTSNGHTWTRADRFGADEPKSIFDAETGAITPLAKVTT